MAEKSLEDMTVDEIRALAARTLPAYRTLQQLTTNPETRETVQRAVKKLNPNLPIPEIDAADSIRALLKTEREERLAFQQGIIEKEMRGSLEAARASAISRYNLSEADVLKVQELMLDKDNPIPTYDAAARVFLASRESARPTPASFVPPVFTMPEKDVWGKGIGNKAALDRIALNEAYSAWSEISAGKVPGLGGARMN